MIIDKDNIERHPDPDHSENAALERMKALDRQMGGRALATKRCRTWIASVAACVLLVACGVTIQEARLANHGKMYSYQMIQHEYSSSNELDSDDILYKANSLLLSEEDIPKNTLNGLDDQLSSLDRRLEKALADTSGFSYLNYGLWETKYKCEWYLSTVLLRTRSYHKAKRQLRKIAGSASPYSGQATSALNQLRFFRLRKDSTKVSEVSFILKCGIKDPASYNRLIIDSLLQSLPDSTRQSIVGLSGARIAETLLYEKDFYNYRNGCQDTTLLEAVFKYGICSSKNIIDTARVGLAFAKIASPAMMRTIGEWCLNNEQKLNEELKAICYYRIIRSYETDNSTAVITDDLRKDLYLMAVKGNYLCSRLFLDSDDPDRFVFLPYCAKYSLLTDPDSFDFWADSLARHSGSTRIHDYDFESILLQRLHSTFLYGDYTHAEEILDKLSLYIGLDQTSPSNGYSSLAEVMTQRPPQYYQYTEADGSLSSRAIKILLRILESNYSNHNTRIPLERARLSWLLKDNKWPAWLNLTFNTFVNSVLPSNDYLLIAQFASPNYYVPYEDLKNACAQYNNNDVRQVYNAALFLKGSVDQLIPHIYKWIKRRCSSSLAQSLDSLRQYGIFSDDVWEEFEVSYSPYVMNDIKEVYPSYDDVATQLNEGECAIEIVRVESLDLKPNTIYKALLLLPNSDEPVQIDLFEETELKRILSKGNSYDSDALYKMLWEPIISTIDGIDTFYISPDGLLNLINISALKTPDGQILEDLYNIFVVTSTREIVRLKSNNEPSSKLSHIALFGGLNYQMDYSASQGNNTGKIILKSNNRVDRSICRGEFRYLPSSLTEVIDIAKAIPKGTVYQPFTGGDGTEEAFKSLSGKGIKLIHLATHGFYYSSSDFSDASYLHSNKTTDPLYRCGLILTSGDNAWKGGKVPEECEDGILLGEEIAKMDLTDTDIVVLSACNTALGDISPDGVAGLRRAFKRAGVNTLILALDKVDDKATCAFMTEFYRQLFSGAERHEAFNKAVKVMRESSSFSSPKYWAPFIMVD